MRILIIEDNIELCRALSSHFEQQEIHADLCHTGEDALFFAEKPIYDVIVLDRMLPVMDGITILKKLRAKNVNAPILLLTALGSISDRIEGLDSGADDYLAKPFDLNELTSRIRALARRSSLLNEEVLAFGGISLNTNKNLASFQKKSVRLSKKEVELLAFFMKKGEQIISRELLLMHVWGAHSEVENGNLDNYIYFLRRKLKSLGGPAVIKAVYRQGFILTCKDTE